jgi:hypothetical protein
MTRTMIVAGLAGLTAALLVGTGCANKDVLAEASFRGGDARYHHETGELYRIYDYYPEAQVYYSPFTQRYFWRNREGNNFGNGWQSNTTLPETIAIHDSSVAVIELPTGNPNQMHEGVLAAHPSMTTLRAQLDEQGNEAPTAVFASVPTEH